MPMTDQTPEKDLKTLEPRRNALDGLIPVDAENVFRRYRPVKCVIKDELVLLVESSRFSVMPLRDPNFFTSFVRLGARRGGEYRNPTEVRIKKWAETFGLPAKRLPKRGTSEAPVSMPLEKFRREVRNAWELWTIYKEIWAADAKAIGARAKDPHSRWDRELAEGLDSRDYRLARSVMSARQAVLRTARDVLDEIASAQIADVRSRVHMSKFSSWCPDLVSALYLQFSLLITRERPKRVCGNCGTLFPLTRKDKYHCDERCYRTAYNHRGDNSN
jgi:hypothetical protein